MQSPDRGSRRDPRPLPTGSDGHSVPPVAAGSSRHVRDAVAAVQAAAPAALRHSAGDDAALVTVAVEVERDAFPEVGTRRILQVQVDVRLAAVAGVARRSPRNWPAVTRSPRETATDSRLQVADEEVFVAARHLDADVIAEPGHAPSAWRRSATSGSPSCAAKTTPGGGRVQRQSVRVVVVQSRPRPSGRCVPLSRDHQVVRPALVREKHVVVDLGGRARPRPRSGARRGAGGTAPGSAVRRTTTDRGRTPAA